MSEPERVPPGADMLGFVTEQMAFVGLGDEDMALIRRTAPLVLAHEEALTSALYDHLLEVPRHRPILPEGGRLARPRAHRAAEAQPRPVAARDGGDRDARGRRLLCPRRGAVPQPPRPAPRRPDSPAVHGRRHEPHPVGARGNPRGRARRSARGAARLGGLEQAHAGPPERVADRLHAAARRRRS